MESLGTIKSHNMGSTLEKAKELFKSMLAQRTEMYDYVTAEIKRGGYYYRMICEIFKVNSITIKIMDQTIHVESSDKVIVFQNDSVSFLRK